MSQRLVVGILADTCHPGIAARLLGDLGQLAAEDRGLAPIEVILLDNPSSDPPPGAARAPSVPGLSVHCVGRAEQERDAARGHFGRIQLPPGRLPIATARRLAQRYASARAAAAGSAVWLLDEDLRLTPLLAAARRGDPPLSERVRRLRAAGVDVAVGPTLGAPPVPARSMVRVNLEDLRRHLGAIAALEPEAPWPDRAAENARARRDLPEYYYDLSRAHGDAGARPMWLEPVGPAETARSALARLADGASGLLDGIPITRPLLEDAALDPAIPALTCGGNTLVLRPDLLAAIPHVAPRIAGRVARRSEMLWARLMAALRGARIARAPIAALHDRSGPGRSSFDAAKLADDVRGSAAVAALDALLGEGALAAGSAIEPAAAARASAVYEERARERLTAIVRSEARTRGLLEEIAGVLDAPGGCWGQLGHPAYAPAVARLRAEIARLAAACAEGLAAWDPAEERADVEAFLRGLPEELAAYCAIS
ncbi:MAG TPA: hypothetical protein VLS89_14470 [Candidatus Nanopelagicales bacterium]|nr:hypothetical protein [Candidatus Nanopelagicales bacterium]